ncbi:hypothetical protein [Bacillus sp. FSL E2-8887]|uniref:hypothetical protein n=1 Tax=Bacillus sp. FSL E2-8887 TaxID=2954599 RepID=UPI0030F5DE61
MENKYKNFYKKIEEKYDASFEDAKRIYRAQNSIKLLMKTLPKEKVKKVVEDSME